MKGCHFGSTKPIAPIASPSRSMGTASWCGHVAATIFLRCRELCAFIGSASRKWTVAPSTIERPATEVGSFGHLSRPSGDGTVVRAGTETSPSLKTTIGIIGFADLAGVLDDRFENRLDVGRRESDHLQDVTAAGLVGEGLRRSRVLACTSSNSSHVLDRDHGLVGEGLQKLDVLLGELAGSLRAMLIQPMTPVSS